MTRETDSSSSGPQGRGGPAYPSGTQPYGARPFPSLHPQERQRPAGTPEAPEVPEPPAEPPADEPRTETTLTTRIRINIPGSRPIPPVVVRTPVEEAPPATGPGGGSLPAPEPGGRSRGGSPAPLDPPTAQHPAPAPPLPAPGGGPDKEEPSDWFVPRKPVPGAPGAEPGQGADTGATRLGTPPGADPPAGFGGGTPGAPDLDPFTDRPYDDRPYAGRSYSANPLTDPDTGSVPAPAPDPAGSYLPPSPPAGSPLGGGAPGPGPHDTPAGGFPSPPSLFPGGAQEGFGTENFPPGVPRPTDPFRGPAQGPADLYAAPPGEGPYPGHQPPAAPAGPTTGPATGAMRFPPDAARNPDLPPSPEFTPPAEGGGGGGTFGDTLVGGIPAVPSAESPPARPAPAPAPRPVPAPAPARKKGRSKLVLLAVMVAGVAVLAYGAGLLMDHADVPKGTTVLGVDIGNQSTEEAVKTLDKALGTRTTAALTLSVGGHRQRLKPSVAGLSIDTDATVHDAAHADYNPVSVIGSLFGGTRTAEPVILVDEDKLKAALKSVAGANGSGTEPMVRFADGRAVPVPGKPGRTFDVNAAATRVAAAYRTRAETGADQPVPLAVSTVPPKVTQAELDRAVSGFGKSAMSGPATVRADAVHQISFNTSLPQFLTMLPTPDGHLQPHIDLAVLTRLYGGTFDGVRLERANGTRTPVTAQDVASALVRALGSTDPAGRTVTLPHPAA